MTDDGYILDDLALSGCKVDSPKRQTMLNVTLSGFGVKSDGKSLEIKASTDNLPLRKHNLVQAMLAVNDLFYLTSHTVVSLFHEELVNWLDLSEIRYTPGVKFTGKAATIIALKLSYQSRKPSLNVFCARSIDQIATTHR